MKTAEITQAPVPSQAGPMLDGLSLFFPCYNEEANVEGLVQDALRVAPAVAREFEIIIVDDGSRDGTAARVAGIATQSPAVRLVRHEKNRGYGEALKSGFRAARLPWVFYSDGDRQFDLNELPRLVWEARGADIVSGFRLKRADPWHRLLNAKIFETALHLFMGLNIPDVDCAFKIYRRDIFDGFAMNATGAMIDAEILSKARRQGQVIKTLGVGHRPRVAGTPTGAKPKVILRAMVEFWKLWWDLRRTPARARAERAGWGVELRP